MENGRRPPDTRTSAPRSEEGVRQMGREERALDDQPLFRAPSGQTPSAAGRPASTYPMAYQERPQRVEIPRSIVDRPQKPPRKAGGGGAREKKPFPIWTIPVILVCLGLIALAGWFVQGEYVRYQQYLAVRDRVNRSVFYPNTLIDGIDMSGKTMAQALGALGEQTQKRAGEFAIAVAYGEKRWRIDSSQVPVGAKYESTLRAAYAYGRSGSLRERYDVVRAIEANGLRMSSPWGYDREKVRELTDLVVSRIDVPVADAKLTAFDPNTRAFVFAPEQVGYKADAEKLFSEVTAALDAGRYDAQIAVDVSAVQPRLRQADISSLFGRIASYSTKTTTSQNRNTNISLSAQAINARVVLPGETLSFNECTGQRTPQKGYLEAGAISGGQLVDETGGGVCQTSSTLFNAVVRADLEIIDRSRHSWPSTYVPRGEDAAVDWPRLDFKFRNNQDTPVFIVAWYADQTVTAEVYGKLMPPGRTVDLHSDTIKETTPSNEVIYTRSLDLPPGTQKVAKQKRTGYVVDTYKVYYQDGVEVNRVKLWRTEYKPVQKEIYFN